MRRILGTTLLLAVLLLSISSTAGAALVQPADLLQDPTAAEWKALEQYDGKVTRARFEEQLKEIFDPTGSLAPFLKVTDQEVTVFASTNQSEPAATISFAPEPPTFPAPEHELLPTPLAQASLPPSPLACLQIPQSASPEPSPKSALEFPLLGLRVVIDPADIGGEWGPMEDRSTLYPGYGRIQEGDLNLLVSRLLSERLKQLGAEVFATRNSAEPVSGLSVAEVQQVVPQVLAYRSYLLSTTFHSRTRNVRKTAPIYQRIVAEVLLTKTLEARARAEKTRRVLQPDITIVLQFDATAARHQSSLPKINRNILFVGGAYTAKELTTDPRQRLRLLTKLLQNVTPTEIHTALAISNHLAKATGFPPVHYGNSKTTRAIADNPYVVARNLLLNREHDGPVVVTEPYFMNQPETLQRLLAGDYEGTKLIAGMERVSIYREYADAVADGLLDAYGK